MIPAPIMKSHKPYLNITIASAQGHPMADDTRKEKGGAM